MQRFLGHDCEWYGNALAIACSPAGDVVDFTKSSIPLFRSLLRKYVIISNLAEPF